MVLKALSCMEVAICTRLITRPAMKPMAEQGRRQPEGGHQRLANHLDYDFRCHE